MNEEMMQALDSIRNDEYQGDKERAYVVKEMMGEDYSKYFNDEGEDVRELAEKAEALRDAILEGELERDNNYLTDAKLGN